MSSAKNLVLSFVVVKLLTFRTGFVGADPEDFFGAGFFKEAFWIGLDLSTFFASCAAQS